MRIEILRRDRGSEVSYLQVFEYTPEDERETIASMLDHLNSQEELKDIEGNIARKITYKKSCLQKKCGACAMLVNGRPALACASKLCDLEEPIRLEPFKKFPVVEDLCVDRSIMKENLKQMKAWFEDEALVSEKRNAVSYESSRCLQCGCCLEVCPNFMVGSSFFGMAGAMPFSRILNEMNKEELKEARRIYNTRVFEGCGKSLSCRDVCPAKIKIGDMLVNSNAIAVWKRYIKD